MADKTCPQCGKTYTGNRRTCSTECARARMRESGKRSGNLASQRNKGPDPTPAPSPPTPDPTPAPSPPTPDPTPAPSPPAPAASKEDFHIAGKNRKVEAQTYECSNCGNSITKGQPSCNVCGSGLDWTGL